METTKLKRFAQYARRSLIDQVEAKLKFVLMGESAARRENPEAVKELEKQIQLHGQALVIDKVAYTWFNRFCALRFMDVNGYTRIRVASPLDGQFQPEILAEAKMGHIDEDMVPTKVRDQISALLSGTASSRDPQQEAYRLLMVAVCNDFHRAMPYLFERIADYTELLMPDDLLSGNSILAYTREAMTPDTCKEISENGIEQPIVEVIGWLYQFYISEKKDEVFDGLKKNKKITPENIPAATQLFTPHWIVRYLVENSLGRLWMLNNPSSKLVEQMDYYIKPQANEDGQASNDFLRINKPEDIKVCDPACGSGHMLTYAFDLLYAIYEETGTDASEIPEKILTHNLYGIEIDERAGELAAFALTMKARGKQRRFFNKGIRPNICVLQNIKFDQNELNEYVSAVGRDLFTQNLRETLTQFEDADNFGSLIRPKLTDVVSLLTMLEAKDMAGNLFLADTHRKVLLALIQTEYLSPKYHVVIANPPYMGSSGMNPRLVAWSKANYPNTKADMFGMFIERNLDIVVKQGLVGMITMQSWMFLSAYEKLRNNLLNDKTITSMTHLGSRAFDSIGGEVVSTTAFVLENSKNKNVKGSFLRLIEGNSEAEKDRMILEAVRNDKCGWFYRFDNKDFQKIPGSPIAYWASPKFLEIFNFPKVLDYSIPESSQNLTGDNNKFLRYVWEVDHKKVGIDKKWLFYAKGGGYRKWYGNLDNVINWSPEARQHYKSSKIPRIIPEYLWYKEGITWGFITTTNPSFRYLPEDATFDVGGSSIFFVKAEDIDYFLGLFNTDLVIKIVNIYNPTLNFQLKDIRNIPIKNKNPETESIIKHLVAECKEISKYDWDLLETSKNFMSDKLLAYRENYRIDIAYQKLREDLNSKIEHLQALETKNNNLFLSLYGIEDEIFVTKELKYVSLECNPHYRYSNNKNDQELENLMRGDTMREFISYAVGCMFGRFSIDKPGFVLSNQDETLADYLHQVPQPKFTPDADNVIPILDGEWFNDDISERFRAFLRVTFGENCYEENLHYIEQCLGKNGKPLPIRDYFLKDFYNDHIKRYKNRPIYWLFSSSKGSFNTLIYMHRYRTDTVSIILNDYLREFRTKLTARKGHLEQLSINQNASSSDKTKSLKELESLKKILVELDEYERDVLYPLATQQIGIDLDDGVKVNYNKFGTALKKISALDSRDKE